MKNNRPVFESFDQFVQFVYEAVQLNEADTTYASPLLKLIKGTMKLSGESATQIDTLITQVFNKIYVDFDDQKDYINSGSNGKVEIDSLIERLTNTFDLLNNSAGLKTIPGSVKSSELTPSYEYLVSGTVRVKDMPVIASGDSNMGIQPAEHTLPLSMLLVAINSHNLFALCNIIDGAKKKKAFLNAGTEAKLNQFYKNTDNNFEKIVQIDTDSLGGELITFKPYEPQKIEGDTAKYAWQFPLYGVLAGGIQPGNQIIDANYYDVVIEPAGNDVVVKDQVYDAPDVKFFAENGVTISEEGKRQLKSVLSQYNSIQTIIVNGGASSKPTSYKSKSGEGNPALATDRMNAGITELNALKKSGVAQLANTKIEAGKAEVQPEGEKSDATKQQVSFIISGMIKSTQVVPKEAVVITNTEEIKADKVTFTKYVLQLNLNEEPTEKNMEARA